MGKDQTDFVSQATEKHFRELNTRGSINGASRFTHRNFRNVVQRDGLYPRVMNAHVLCKGERIGSYELELLEYGQRIQFVNRRDGHARNLVTN